MDRQSREEIKSGSQTMMLYTFAAIAVFLALAALYESWSIPMAVILVVPFKRVASGVWLRGYDNGIYFQSARLLRWV